MIIGERAAPDITKTDPIALVAGLARSGLHDEYVVYERAGEWVYAGGTRCRIALDSDRVEIVLPDGTRRTETVHNGGAVALATALAALPMPQWRAYGWIGFDFAGGTDTGGRPARRLARLLIPSVEVRASADRVEITSIDPAEADAIRAVIDSDRPFPAPGPELVDVRQDKQGYRDHVRLALSEIAAGRYEKVILSRRVPLPGPVDFPATYVAGRRANTPARSFLLGLDGLHCAGFSPELVVTIDKHGLVTTNPLAGTRAFGFGSLADLAARAELVTDPKEVYEHAISVRTALEEIRSVSVPGSARVSEFMGVAERGSVQHLASTVQGQLAEARTGWDAFEALFPAITASGVPKAGSVDAINRLDEPRGLYSGCVVMTSSEGDLDAALVLRAVFQEDGQAWLRAGAGIVKGSVPDREFEETCEKLRSVLPFVVPQL
ncbi:salicylate synthase [Dactylosporangium sp. NPDC005572]|uniref:salicylate synthase n=1 Tax=Dactylosporangium sp. NPDC005572 TaxID=3156889 RepID=UPI0033B46CCC